MIGHGHGHRHAHGFGGHPGPWDLKGVDPSTAGVLSAFRETMHLNRQLFMRLAAGSGGHAGRTIVLGILASHDGITQKDLAARMHLARPTVTIMLQKMEHEGLIERWDDPADQRLTRIRLTDAGRALGKDTGDIYARYVNTTIGSLSEADRLEFARLLGLMSENITAALKELEA